MTPSVPDVSNTRYAIMAAMEPTKVENGTKHQLPVLVYSSLSKGLLDTSGSYSQRQILDYFRYISTSLLYGHRKMPKLNYELLEQIIEC